MQLIRRSQWGAPAVSTAPVMASAQGVTVHWLGTRYSVPAHSGCAAKVKQIRDSHLRHPTENWLDIAYNALACAHGYVFEGRGAGRRSGANGTAALNSRSYAVCALWGTDSGRPGDGLLTALADARAWMQANGAGTALWAHSDGVATQCPGPDLLAWVRAGGPRPAAPPAAGTGSGTHTVRVGDTLSAIGGRLGVRWQDIAAANALTAPYVIHPGQVLKLPAGSRPATYTVRAGDTLSGIGAQYGVRWQDIAAANALTDPYVIRPGQVLRLPAGGAAPAAPVPPAAPVSYEPFPGAAFFRVGRNSPVITAMGRRLVAEGCGRYQVGPGPNWTSVDQVSYAAWQRKLGFAGPDADGIPGRTSWDRLKVPRT